MERFVRPRLNAYLSHAVEPVLAGLLREAPASELVPFPPAFVGRHWTPSSELDVALLDAERTRALIVEIKWTRAKVDPRVLDALRARVQADPAFQGVLARTRSSAAPASAGDATQETTSGSYP